MQTLKAFRTRTVTQSTRRPSPTHDVIPESSPCPPEITFCCSNLRIAIRFMQVSNCPYHDGRIALSLSTTKKKARRGRKVLPTNHIPWIDLVSVSGDSLHKAPFHKVSNHPQLTTNRPNPAQVPPISHNASPLQMPAPTREQEPSSKAILAPQRARPVPYPRRVSEALQDAHEGPEPGEVG